jgi:hypothetical protein
MTDHVIKIEPMMGVFTPYALARSSHHLFNMACTYDSEKDAWLIRLYMFCAAIELGLKAAILGEDCTAEKKLMMKQIGHDLLKLNAEFELARGVPLFDEGDVTALDLINPHFRQKGLEYFTLPILEITLCGGNGLPSVEAMRAAGGKVDAFLESKKFIIDGKTSQTPAGGIIHFV